MTPFAALRSGLIPWGVMGLSLSLLSGCAAPDKRPVVSTQPVQARVVATWPMTDPAAQAACPPPPAPAQQPTPQPAPNVATQGYCVVYQHQGQTYSVGLPTDPGDHLTLQMPSVAPTVMPAPVPVPGYAAVPPPYPLVYPGVVYFGAYYRPRPYVLPLRPVVAPPRWRDGRRHGH